VEKWVPWWEKTKPVQAPTTDERYRIGPWTLHATIGEAGPSYFSVRRDGEARPTGASVVWQAHDGWVIAADDDRYCSRVSPVDCLGWWVARRR
jgi:hypothetical protein